MGKHKGKRVTLTVAEEEFTHLQQMQKAGGFRSMSRLLGAVVAVLVNAPRLAGAASTSPATVEEEISRIFSEFADWELPRYEERCRTLQRTAP